MTAARIIGVSLGALLLVLASPLQARTGQNGPARAEMQAKLAALLAVGDRGTWEEWRALAPKVYSQRLTITDDYARTFTYDDITQGERQALTPGVRRLRLLRHTVRVTSVVVRGYTARKTDLQMRVLRAADPYGQYGEPGAERVFGYVTECHDLWQRGPSGWRMVSSRRLGVAHRVDGKPASAWNTPIPDPDPRATARIKNALLRTQAGDDDLSAYTAKDRAQIAPEERQEDTRALRQFGPLRSFVPVRHRAMGVGHFYQYRALFGATRLLVWAILTPSGQIDAHGILRE